MAEKAANVVDDGRPSSEYLQEVMMVPEADGTMTYCKTVDIDDEVEAAVSTSPPHSEVRPTQNMDQNKVELEADANNNEKTNDEEDEETGGKSVTFLQLVRSTFAYCI